MLRGLSGYLAAMLPLMWIDVSYTISYTYYIL